VIILASRHVTSLRELTVAEWGFALDLWRSRLRRTRRPATATRTCSSTTGAPQVHRFDHTHAQLVAVPRSAHVDRMVARSDREEGCSAALSQPILAARVGERRPCARVAGAPRTAGALVLTPASHCGRLEDVDSGALAGALTIAVGALPDGAFNLWLVLDANVPDSHWYIELVPASR